MIAPIADADATTDLYVDVQIAEIAEIGCPIETPTAKPHEKTAVRLPAAALPAVIVRVTGRKAITLADLARLGRLTALFSRAAVTRSPMARILDRACQAEKVRIVRTFGQWAGHDAVVTWR